ncbi:MAG: heme-binding protein [Chitinophagales bacterium]|nr:MAG: heme-binding protein [Chitinophagales bacterium]
MAKKILWILIAVLIIMQFFRPGKNITDKASPQAIGNHYPLPAEVKDILQVSCFDCHSNNTRYPWYAEIQPFGWLLANHIKEGKEHLNFDEFASYSRDDQLDYFEDIEEVIQKKEMPLKSYTFIHRDARLNDSKMAQLLRWTADCRTYAQKAASTHPQLDEPDEEHEEER